MVVAWEFRFSIVMNPSLNEFEAYPHNENIRTVKI